MRLLAFACATTLFGTQAGAREFTPDTPPDPVPDPGGSVTADDLARGTVDVPGSPIDDNSLHAFGIADRLEVRSNEGDTAYLWDVSGYLGGDYNRLRIESEGEGTFDGNTQAADLQLLYSRAVTPYWNARVGWRRTFEPDGTDHLVIGAEGLNLFWTSVSADLYISEDGDVSSTLEVEYDEPLTQRLMLTPRAEVNLQFQDVDERALGAGITDYEIGLRLRYEIVREFAPYIGVSWERTVFGTADLLPEDEDAGALSAVAGVRAWY